VFTVTSRSPSSSGDAAVEPVDQLGAWDRCLSTMVEPRCTIVVSQPLQCRSWATSWPLVPVPITSAFLPRQSAPFMNSVVCSTSPLKSFNPGNSGMCGEPNQSVGEDQMLRMQRAFRAIGIAHHRIPFAGGLVVGFRS